MANNLKNIKKLRVMAYDYEVLWIKNAAEIYKIKFPPADGVDGGSDEVWGWCDFAENRIYVDESLLTGNIFRAAEILLHEWIHAGHEFLGLDDKSTEEEFTDRQAKILMSYMRDNAEAFHTIINIASAKKPTK